MKPKIQTGYTYDEPKRAILIELLDEDCKAGTCGDPSNCPVHRCLEGSGYVANQALVGWRVIKIFRGDKESHYQVPTNLGNQIKAYDNGSPCWKPGMYALKPYPYRDVPVEEKEKWNKKRHHGGSSKSEKNFKDSKIGPRLLELSN